VGDGEKKDLRCGNENDDDGGDDDDDGNDGARMGETEGAGRSIGYKASVRQRDWLSRGRSIPSRPLPTRPRAADCARLLLPHAGVT
jgi:hypothetical protein